MSYITYENIQYFIPTPEEVHSLNTMNRNYMIKQINNLFDGIHTQSLTNEEILKNCTLLMEGYKYLKQREKYTTICSIITIIVIIIFILLFIYGIYKIIMYFF